MKMNLVAVLIFLFAVVPGSAFWGANGHRIVGYIAEQHVLAATKAALEGILGPESLARAATFPDEVRSNPTWDFAKPWHFVSIDDGETFENTPRDRKGDILKALSCFEQVLRDPDAARPDKVIALRYLVHLVGDVHQPLHVGRRADRGANSIQVEFFGKSSNLHSVWDEGLIQHQGLSFSEFAGFIDHPTESQVKTLQSGTYRNWAQESYDLRGKVYNFSSLPQLSWGYAYQKTPIVRLRLLQGGIRLAGVLDSIFSPEASSRQGWSHPDDKDPKTGCEGLGSKYGTE